MIAHPQILFGAVMLSVVALVAWLFWMLPLWSRPGIFFAVTVVPDFRKSRGGVATPAQLSDTRFCLHVAISFALILTGAVLQRGHVSDFQRALADRRSADRDLARAQAKAIPHAVAVSTIREASLSPRHDASARRMAAWSWHRLQFCCHRHLSASALGARFRIAFRFTGASTARPNGWSVRTPMGVYGPCVLGRGSRGRPFAARLRNFARPASNPATARHRQHDFAHRMAMVLVGVEFFLAAIFSMVGLLPFTGNPGVVPIVILTAATACFRDPSARMAEPTHAMRMRQSIRATGRRTRAGSRVFSISIRMIRRCSSRNASGSATPSISRTLPRGSSSRSRCWSRWAGSSSHSRSKGKFASSHPSALSQEPDGSRRLTKAASYHNFKSVMKLLRTHHSHHHHVNPCPRRCG